MSKVLTGNETVSIIGNYAKSKASIKEIAEFAISSGGVTSQELEEKLEVVKDEVGKEIGKIEESKADKAKVVGSVNGRVGIVTLNKNDVGLGRVDNTSDAEKPLSTATKASLELKVDLAGLHKTYNALPPTIHTGETVDFHELDFGEHTIRTDTAKNAPPDTSITLVNVIRTHDEFGDGTSAKVLTAEDFEQGTVAENVPVGSDYSKSKYPASEPLHSTRIRNKNPIPISEFSTVSVEKGYSYCVLAFDSEKKYLGRTSYIGWSTEPKLTFPDAVYIAVAVRIDNTAQVTPDMASKIKLTITTLGQVSGGSKLLIAWGATKGDLHTCVNIAGAWSSWRRISTPLPVDANEGDHLIFKGGQWKAVEVTEKFDIPEGKPEEGATISYRDGKWVVENPTPI